MSATLPLADRTPAGAGDFVRPLAGGGDVASVGGKAATLARLIALGIAVPDGIVLSVAVFEAHLAEHDLSRRIDDMLERLDARDTAALPRASRAIRALVAGAPLDPALRAALMTAAAPLLADGPVVVRSSAVGEDSGQGSFAGQLDSILHVSDEAALERAVLACWASYWSDRALFYRCARALPLRGMGVIVQRQVAARCAGVLFTDGGDDDVLFEYGAGLGDTLVSGAMDPGRVSVGRRTHVVRTLATLGEPNADVDALIHEQSRIDQLIALAALLENRLGGPQDVEWAVDDVGSLFVVQSRPITAAPVRVVTHTPPAASRVAWSNANVNENFPDPVSPLLYSIASAGYAAYFRNLATGFGISRRRRQAMEPAFARIIGVHGARMYYNLTSIHRVLRLAPFGDSLAQAFDTFVGARGQDATPTAGGLAPVSRFRERLEVAVIACKTAWQYLWLPLRVARFERRADALARRTHPVSLATMPLASLRAALAEFMEIRLRRWNDAALADAAAMVCYAALERVLGRAYSATDGAVHTSLLKAIPDVVSSKPVTELWALSRTIRATPALAEVFATAEPRAVLEAVACRSEFSAFHRQLDRYLDQWGFRCSAELMLTAPSFQEEPEPLVAVLRAYAQLDGESPVEALARQAADRRTETARVLTELRGRPLFGRWPIPTYAQVVRVLIAWTHASIRFRERARLKQALLYSRCRRVALALGTELVRRDVIARRDDVFWLTVHELDDLASGGAMFPRQTRELVALRARAHAEAAAVAPPDAFELGEGEYWTTLPGDTAVPLAATTGSREMAGISACGGSATGQARVLRDVTEAERLGTGDILVTRQTDPGWGPVFFLISALVIERGGMLSHGAIIAREFGLPCVVGVRDATRLIPDGSTITVDGDHGRVLVD